MSTPVPLCRYVLDNGSRCRCAALTGDTLCRHHTPEALSQKLLATAARLSRPSAAPSSQSPAPATLSRPSYWRSRYGDIAQAQPDQFMPIIEQLLEALGANQISHRCAGRLLHQIQKRRHYLMLEMAFDHVRELSRGVYDLTEEHREAILAMAR